MKVLRMRRFVLYKLSLTSPPCAKISLSLAYFHVVVFFRKRHIQGFHSHPNILRARAKVLLANFNSFFWLAEPVGAKAPTFSSESKGSIFVRPVASSFALLCQAQAFPVPLIRLNFFERIFEI